MNKTAQQTVKTISILIFLTCSGILADTHYVSKTGANTSPYTSWPTAARVIQDAVDVATANDTVLVANGVYSDGGGITPGNSVSNRVVIAKSITVISLHGPDKTVIMGAPDPGSGEKGDYAVRCAYLTNGAQLIGFTLSNGYTRMTGGSQDLYGGGALLDHGGVVSNCTILYNDAHGGGGACCYYGGSVISCSLISNLAFNVAGGVYMVHGGITLNCIIERNRAGNGGGVSFWYNGMARNCLIQRNYSSWAGGGIKFSYGGVVDNCTISENWAHIGGGVHCQNGGTNINNIIYFNIAVSNYPCHSDVGSGMRYEYCCTATEVTGVPDGGGNITNNPSFRDRPYDDFRLKAGSHCVDVGINLAWTMDPGATDLDGDVRIYNGVVDIGAYEWVPEGGMVFSILYSVFCIFIYRRKFNS